MNLSKKKIESKTIEEQLEPFEVLSDEIAKAIENVSIFFLRPGSEKALVKKLKNMKLEIDRCLWAEDVFFYTILHPKDTGLDCRILAPCRHLNNGPYILTLKKEAMANPTGTRDDYEMIEIRSIEQVKQNAKCSKKLKQFIAINQIALIKHWALITGTSELCNELNKI